MTWTQLLTLPLTVLLVGWLAKRARRPSSVVDGWHIVDYVPAFRWLTVVLCLMMLTCGSVLVPTILANRSAPTSTLVFAVLLILVVVLLSIYGMLFAWRNWVKYNDETLISSTSWKRPQTIQLADLRFTGVISARGHQYTTAAGDTAYVNSYQRGASELIEMLSRQ
jgi:hypothetical protein